LDRRDAGPTGAVPLEGKTGETPVPLEGKTGETPVPLEGKTGETPVPPRSDSSGTAPVGPLQWDRRLAGLAFQWDRRLAGLAPKHSETGRLMGNSILYQVPCRCGRSLRGQRRAVRQIVSCPHCGRKCLIFPSGPWLAPAAPAMATPAHLKLGRLFLVVLVGGVGAMALIFFLVRPYLRPSIAADEAADRRSLLDAGERSLREGNVHVALQELNAARTAPERPGGALSRAEQHRLDLLRQQSELLTHLLDSPLEDLIHRAMQHRNAEDWRAKFQDYRGRSVIFDDMLRRDGQGRPVLGAYVVQAGAVEVRLALEDLTLLRQLPLDPPRRWLFGVRLASCWREEGGVWVIRFEPESGVLLTDESAAAACCPLPLDKELLDVLKRQNDWLKP
jgi:hypothetical protein